MNKPTSIYVATAVVCLAGLPLSAGQSVLQPQSLVVTQGREVSQSVLSMNEQPISLTVVRPDGRRSAAKEVSFVAARERVEVPANYWQPASTLSFRDQVECCPLEYVGPELTNAFHVRVNTACALESVGVTGWGQVTRLDGWEGEPAYDGNLRIIWRPTPIRHTVDNGLLSDTWTWVVGAEFQINASALCPVGVRP